MNLLIFTNDYVVAAKQLNISKERAIEELENFFYDYRGKKVLSKEDLPSGKDTVIIPVADNNANATEPDFYFVFDRKSILSSEVTKKIFKAHRSSFYYAYR